VKIDLPPAVTVPSQTPPKPIYITIEQNGHLHIGDYPTDVDSLAADLKTQIGRRDPTHERIYIRADKNTYYGDFMRVMNQLQDSGFYSVGLIGLDQRGGSSE
jgi:biopolymer transport protein ExbD